jgi:hypothetical protein
MGHSRSGPGLSVQYFMGHSRSGPGLSVQYFMGHSRSCPVRSGPVSEGCRAALYSMQGAKILCSQCEASSHFRTLNVVVATCTVQGTPAPTSTALCYSISTALCYSVSTARLNCVDKHDSIMLSTYCYSDKRKHVKLHTEFWLGIMKVQGQLRNVNVAYRTIL